MVRDVSKNDVVKRILLKTSEVDERADNVANALFRLEPDMDKRIGLGAASRIDVAYKLSSKMTVADIAAIVDDLQSQSDKDDNDVEIQLELEKGKTKGLRQLYVVDTITVKTDPIKRILERIPTEMALRKLANSGHQLHLSQLDNK